jgi:hypothetical protein
MVHKAIALMPKFEITSPTGQKFEITAPEGATEAQIIEFAQHQAARQAEAAPTDAPRAEFGVTGARRGRLPKGEQIGTGFEPVEPPTGAQLGSRYGSIGRGLYTGAAEPFREGARLVGEGLQAVAPEGSDLEGYARGKTVAIKARTADLLARNQRARAEAGYTGFDLPRMVGNVAGTLPALAAVPPGAGLAARIASGATQGGIAGALTTTDDKDPYWEQKVRQVGTGMAIGGGVGAGSKLIEPRGVRAAKPPTTAELKTQANAAYASAESAGVQVAQPAWTSAVDDIGSAVRAEGFHPKLHPRVAVALDELQAMKGAAPTLQETELFRRVARNAGASADASERRLGQILIDKLDDFVEGLTPAQLAAGDKAGVEALTQARSLWQRMRKSEMVEDLVERAGTQAGQFTGSGYENALRTQFRQLALNAKKMRGFSGAEQDAIKKVARGGPTENFFRFMGKMAPRGVVSGMFNIATTAAGGPALGMATTMAGETGRRIATGLTERNAQIAAELMRAGGQAVPTAATMDPARRAIVSALTSGLVPQATR